MIKIVGEIEPIEGTIGGYVVKCPGKQSQEGQA